MSSTARIAVVSVVLVASVLWALGPRRFDVLGPRLGSPAILRPGEAFDVELRTSLPLWSPACELQLIGPAGEVLPLNARRLGGTFPLVLRAELPAGLAEGGYDLRVAGGGHTVLRTRAVHVVESFPERVTLVQLADLPTFGGDGSGDARMRAIVDEINVIHPDLVLLSGDIAYGGQWQQYGALYAALERLDAPAVVAIGNHEHQGLAAYFTLFGVTDHVVDHGSLRILSLDSGHGKDRLTRSQYHRARRWLEQHDGPTVVQMHHPLFWRRHVGAMVDRLVADCTEHDVPVVLSGHWHADHTFDATGTSRTDTWDFPGTKFAVTTAAGAALRPEFSSSPPHHGYRVLRLRGGELESYTYDYDGDGERDASSSHPAGMLRVESTGDGEVTVHNDLNEDLPHARVRVTMAGEPRDLVPEPGALVRKRFDGQSTEYLVQLDLPRGSRTVVRLLPGR